MPDHLTMGKVSRDKTIAIETLESRIQSIDTALKKADNMDLSFGGRMDFLKGEGSKWVENIRQEDPEMFVQWLKMNKDHIQNGHADLADLPSSFTMEDFHSYVSGKHTK